MKHSKIKKRKYKKVFVPKFRFAKSPKITDPFGLQIESIANDAKSESNKTKENCDELLEKTPKNSKSSTKEGTSLGISSIHSSPQSSNYMDANSQYNL